MKRSLKKIPVIIYSLLFQKFTARVELRPPRPRDVTMKKKSKEKSDEGIGFPHILDSQTVLLRGSLFFRKTA